MNDPYETLGLTTDAGEAEIRRRYLELVRQFPPDRAPERFTAIHAAYEALRDPARRLQAQLFQMRDQDRLAGAVWRPTCGAGSAEVRLPVANLLELADSP